VSRAQKIIVPTNTVRNDLIHRFAIQPNKVITTYEGATARVLKKFPKASVLSKYNIKEPYILYVGSLYPHKNVEAVVRALKTMENPPTLVIVSGRNVFWQKFNKFVSLIKGEKLVNLVGYVPDEDLGPIYNAASGYVFPSLAEGFGLPGLEAMAYQTPLLASDIPVLKEVYEDAAYYFKGDDIKDIADKIKEIMINQKLKDELIKKGTKRLKNFSWKKMAEETLKIYESV
jgi:glycosyltransferase involved in cell wall biosynthesis